MRTYSTSEYGTLITAIMLIVLGMVQLSYFGQLGSKPLTVIPYLILTALFTLLVLLFYKLTISVGTNEIVLTYGIGLIKIKKPVDQILSMEEITTPWYWGMGIRFTPKGTLYNIQSRKVLDIKYFQNGKEKRLLIGNKNRDKLKEILQQFEVQKG